MANSSLVEVTMEIADMLLLKQYLRYRANQNNKIKPEFIILLKTFLMIVTYQMAPFRKEINQLRIKELL